MYTHSVSIICLPLENMLFLYLILSALCVTEAFQPQTRVLSRHSPINGVISPEEIDFDFDVGQGGVRLAEESVVKVMGVVKHKPGQANPKVQDLLRYTGLVEVSDVANVNIVTTGRGKEDYRDPGETASKEVIMAPLDAVRDSLNAAGSAMEYPRLVINFAGGDDLQILEVTEAITMMVLDLDIKTKCDIMFNSISDSSFPMGTASVTVVGLAEESVSGGLEGAAKSVANGEVYFYDGKYWTVSEGDINSALA